MCSVVAGLTALSGMMQYRAQKQQADSQASMYRAQADAAERNAQLENRKQEQIADNYAQKSLQLRSRQRLSEGAQRAETGAAGLGFSGSSMDILSSGLDAYRQDQMNNLYNQRNDNFNSRVTESNYLAQAASARNAASNVQKAAKWQSIGTILGTAASVIGAGAGGGMSGGGKSETSFGDITTDAGHNVTATWKADTGNFVFGRTNVDGFGRPLGYKSIAAKSIFGNTNWR